MSRLDVLYQKAVDFEDNNVDTELTAEEKEYLTARFKKLVSKNFLTKSQREVLKTIVSILIMYKILDSVATEDIYYSKVAKEIISKVN